MLAKSKYEDENVIEGIFEMIIWVPIMIVGGLASLAFVIFGGYAFFKIIFG